MKKFTIGATFASVLLLSASAVVAAPCHTTDKGKSPNQTTNAMSSDVDTSSKNTAGGAQPGSSGTVGAMNNAGSNQGRMMASKDGEKSDKVSPGAKNLAGGDQPASPGTVGAMNDTGADQMLGSAGQKDDDC